MKNKILFLPLLGLGLVIGINVYFRSYPVSFPQLASQAKAQVQAEMRQRSAGFVDKNFPGLSSMSKDTLAEVSYREYAKNNREKIRSDVEQRYSELKDRFQDKFGRTYLFELDCWHWARYVENTVKTGHPGDTVVDGKQYDLFMNYPTGTPVSYNQFLFYACASFYKLASFFFDIPLNTFLFYVPLFLSVIFLSALYLICWRFYGALSAAIASLFVGLAPIFLPRSCAGWFDMDILNLFFPLMVVFSYLMAYSRGTMAHKIVWLAASAVLTGLFSFTWPYWWFVAGVIGLYELYSLLNLLSERIQYRVDVSSELKRHLTVLGVYIPLCVIGVVMFSGIEPLRLIFFQVKDAFTLNDPMDGSIWPNVFSTVGELVRPSMYSLSNFVGGPGIFLLSMLCMLALLLRNKRYRGMKRESIFMLIIWFILIFAICYKGVRLVVFLVIPMGIFLGWGCGESLKYIVRLGLKKRRIFLAVWGVIIFFIVGSALSNAKRVANGLFPMIDDNWYMLLNNVKKNTPADSVINSWWDFGDWFKTVAGRKVIFDGQSQNTPQAYWMARALLADSEEESLAILKMLNSSGNKLFELINKEIKDPFKAVMYVEKAIGSGGESAEETLSSVLSPRTVREALNLLSVPATKAYFVVDHTMVSKMPPISYLGNWDFRKVYVVKNIKKLPKERIIEYLLQLGMDDSSARTLYQDASLLAPGQEKNWISSSFRYMSGVVEGRLRGEMVYFDNGLVYNPKDATILAYNGYEGRYSVPKSLFYLENGELVERVYPQSDKDFSVLLMRDNGTYRIVEMDRELGASLFTKLFFLKGKGLRNFRPFASGKDKDNHIGVFEIDWNSR